MKFFAVVLMALMALVPSDSSKIKHPVCGESKIGYNYLTKVGLPLANKIRDAETKSHKGNYEEPSMKITDGCTARLGDFPYQAGLIADFSGGQSVCGGSLLNSRRVLTAAHCWWDGIKQANRFTVVLGSITLFHGGTRIQTNSVVMHKGWNPRTLVNDITMVLLPSAVTLSGTISPVALPSGAELSQNFVGETVIASGFGLTHDNSRITDQACLNHVTLQIIANEECCQVFQDVHSSNICAIGADGKNVCGGDSGGPLVITRNRKPVLVGITSFGSKVCQNGLPAAYTRVTNFIDWIKSLL